MIAFVFGTTGELIKVAPVIRRLRELDVEFLSITTAQQADQLPTVLAEFDLPEPDIWLAHGARGGDLRKHSDLPRWFATVWWNFAKCYRSMRKRLIEGAGTPIVVVHGDTMTTVLGAVMGRALRVPVAHLEAGLRSGDLRNPFPEELHRRIVTRLARIHFAPGEIPARNLGTRHGLVVDTESNTIVDSLGLVNLEGGTPTPVPKPFGIVSLHRSELIDDRERFTAVLECLHEHTRRVPMVFINHSITDARIRDYDLLGKFDDRFVLVPKQSYFPFVRLLLQSDFVVTDSGGLQEECAWLGHPCLVHRVVSERHDGFGASVVLSRDDLAVLRGFLDDPTRYRLPRRTVHESPTDRVVSTLLAQGFAMPRATSV